MRKVVEIDGLKYSFYPDGEMYVWSGDVIVAYRDDKGNWEVSTGVQDRANIILKTLESVKETN